MRWLVRLLASSALSLALVLCGFCAGAGTGAKAGQDIQTAYAIGEGMAARAFATLLGSVGFSVGAYAATNNQSFDDAAQGLYDAFSSSGNASVDPIKNACFAMAASPAGVTFANLGLTAVVLTGLAQWIQGQKFLNDSALVYPDVTVSSGSKSYSIPVTAEPSFSVPDHTYSGATSSYFFFYSYYHDGVYTAWNPTKCVFVSGSAYSDGSYFYTFDTDSVWNTFRRYYPSGNDFLGGSTSVGTNFVVSSYTQISSLSPFLALLLNSSYAPTGTGVSVPADTAVSGAPANVTTGSTATDAKTFADAVSANLADKTLVTDGTTVNNYSYGDIVTDGTAAPPADGILDWLQENFGALQGTLEGVLEGVQAIPDAFATSIDTVLEGVQTFFQPVVDFFSPTPKTDDDFKALVVGSGNGSHTFTKHFPFCVLNDYLSAFNSLAVQQKGRVAANYTPVKFVITLPDGYKDSSGKPIEMDLTHYFTDKHYGLTMGDFSKICFSVITFLAVLSFVARLVSIADLPANFSSSSEDDDGKSRLL